MQSNTVEIYLVGDCNAQKTNRWEAMTNSKAKALEQLAQIDMGQIKTIKVKESAK